MPIKPAESLENPGGRLVFLDALRVFALLGVIMIHVTGWILEEHFGDFPLSTWLVADVFNSCVRASVPLFVMISGALLLGKSEPLWDFFRKRFSKILIPFFLYGLLYLGFRWFDEGTPFSVLTIFRSFRRQEVFFHLWFVYLIVKLYLVTPLIRFVLRYLSRKHLFLILAFWLLTETIFPFIGVWKGTYLGGYLGYFLLGHYLRNSDFLATMKGLLYFICAAAYGFTVFAVYAAAARPDWPNQILSSAAAPHTLLFAGSLFLIFKNGSWTHSPILTLASDLSYEAYLAHALFNQYMRALFGEYLVGNPVTGMLLYFLSTAVLTYLFVFSYKQLFRAFSFSRAQRETTL